MATTQRPRQFYAERFIKPKFPKANMGDWQGRHLAAVQGVPGPHGSPECGIANMIHSWLFYADWHRTRYESGIGEDGVLGDEWAKIGLAMLGLLNGELGRLDGGTLDGLIRGVMQDEGFSPDTM